MRCAIHHDEAAMDGAPGEKPIHPTITCSWDNVLMGRTMKVIYRVIHHTAFLLSILSPLCGVAVSQASHPSLGILRSTDSGKNWKQAFGSDFDVDHLVIDKVGHVLASTMIVTPNKASSELYIFGPEANSRKRITLPGVGPKGELILDLLAAPDGSVFALLRGRVLRTEDGGYTWTVIASSLPASFKSLQLGSDHSLLGFPEDGLYQSTDSGKSWHSLGFDGQKVDRGITFHDGTSMVNAQCKLIVIPISPDRAADWLFPKDDCPHYSELASDARGHLFINTSHGVLKSDVIGKTWKKTLWFEAGVMPFGIAVAPDGDVFAVVLKGVSRPTLFRSIDAGETWQIVQQLGRGVTVSQFAFAPDGTVYAGLNSFGD